jgi:Domain of unknown function (DUF5127)/Domain of unknown function (DUF4964)
MPCMSLRCLWISLLGMILATHLPVAQSPPPLRPPAVPLVAHDPYFSIWSPADKLTDADTVHWTGKPHRLTSLVRIDGKAFRLMGKEPASVPALPQTNLEVLPTRTIYTFEGEGVRLTLTFMTPALPEDLDVLSRPVTYLTCEFKAADDQRHEVSIYLDASTEIGVNENSQPVACAQITVPELVVINAGSKDQLVLQRKGDDVRIDWGYFYIAAPRSESPREMIAAPSLCRAGFIRPDMPLPNPAEGAGIVAEVRLRICG